MENAGYLTWDRNKQAVLDFSRILLASFFIGLCAQIRIPLFFTPVPITGQTLAVMLIGATLGSRKGALAVICYLAQGCLGLPVWVSALGGPTSGYLIGFVFEAYLIGILFERKNRLPVFLKIALPALLQLSMGTLWLSQFVGWQGVWIMGFIPFLPGELFKAILIVIFLKYPRKKVPE